MRSLRNLLLAAFAASLLGTVAVADPAKGVVAVAYDGVPQQIHPVAIQEIDGKAEPLPLRDTHYMTPGKHTFRLASVFGDAANIQRGNTGSRAAEAAVLEVDVQAGKRYLIGAKLEGRKASEWKPIIVRVEDIGS